MVLSAFFFAVMAAGAKLLGGSAWRSSPPPFPSQSLPAFGALLGWLAFAEPLGAGLLGGGAAIVAAVFLAAGKGTEEPPLR